MYQHSMNQCVKLAYLKVVLLLTETSIEDELDRGMN